MQDTARAAWLALAAMVAASPVLAQKRSVGDDLGDGVRDIFHVWGSPFHPAPKDLEGLAVVGGLMALTLPFDRTVQDWIEENPGSLPVALFGPFRESSPLSLAGRTKLLFPTSVALYTAGLIFDSDALRDAGLGCAASNAATSLSRTTMNRIVGRERPSTGNGPFAFKPFTFRDWDVRSFPGGHAANIMSCASYWNHSFDLDAAGPLLYAFAGAVGTARTVDGAHWLSDTVVGLAWGFAVGKAVAARVSDRARERKPGDSQPVAVLVWSVRF